MTYYITTHRDEDLNALQGQALDSNTSHMIYDTGYDLANMRDVLACHPWKVLWEMERDSSAKYGWKFKGLVGIPRR